MISEDKGDLRRKVQTKLMSAVYCREEGGRFVYEGGQRNSCEVIDLTIRFHALEIEKVVDQVGQSQRFTMHDRKKLLLLRSRKVAVQHEFGESAQTRERGAQFMTHGRHEFFFDAFRFAPRRDILNE